MRAYAGLVALDALTLALGYALLYALGLARARTAGLAYVAGWALLGTLTSLLLVAGIPAGVVTTVVAVAAASALLAVAGRRAVRDVHRGPALPRRPLPLAVVAAAGAIVAVQAATALIASLRYDWDPFLDVLTAWLPRAAIVHFDGSLDPAAWQSFVTPWYPPLFPAAHGTAFDFAGGYHPSVLMLQQALLGLAFVGAVAALAGRYAPAWLTLPVLAALLGAPWFWWRLRSLLPDQSLGYLLALAALACVLWLHERRRAWVWLAVVLLAAAALTKIEGVIFGGLLALVVLAAAIRDRRLARSAAPLLLGPAAIVPWMAWLAAHRLPTSTPDYNAPKLVDPGYLADNVERLRIALRFLLKGPFEGPLGFEPLTATLTCAALAVFAVAATRVPALVAPVAAWLSLSLLALGAIYWTSRVEIGFYVSTSASRVGTTLIIAAVALTPLLLGIALRRDEGA